MMNEITIYIPKRESSEVKDSGVPPVGKFSTEELRHPLPRNGTGDLFGKNVLPRLRLNAVNRLLYFGHDYGREPFVHFPVAEHVLDEPFTVDHWKHYGDMEGAVSRTAFMLDTYPTRLFPKEYDDITRAVLRSGGNILHEWGNSMPKVNEAAVGVYERIGAQMVKAKIPDTENYTNGARGAFQAPPIFYEVSKYTQELEMQVWDRALTQMVEELHKGDRTNIQPFIELSNIVRDPVTPLRSTLHRQVSAFAELHERSITLGNGQTPEQGKALAAQLAVESSFLALPNLKDVAYIRYAGHHELPYIFVDITKLPRGEFADPIRVVDVLKELIDDSKEHGEVVATPITVSHFQGPHQLQPELFIVDGNNRATAMLMMKFADFLGFDKDKIQNYKEDLRRFVGLHNLDIEWERDLTVALNILSPEDRDFISDNQKIARQFAHAQVPALLVQEPNFHTVAVRHSTDSEIVLLHPAHQTIYNDPRWSIAVFSKGMAHGRAKGNDIKSSIRSSVSSWPIKDTSF